MGFLDRILAAEQADIHNDWKVLQEVHQLDSLISDSFNKPVVIFKHSIRCGTSAMAKFQLEQSWDFSAEDLDFYYLDLINHRKISNQIAEVLNVVHQSPQIIVLKNGEAVYNTSHTMISNAGIHAAIEN